MRFWLKPEDRRPSPAPVLTDDRVAFGVGLVVWLIVVALTIVLGSPQAWVWAAVTGVVLGVLGIAYTQFKRRRRGNQ